MKKIFLLCLIGALALIFPQPNYARSKSHSGGKSRTEANKIALEGADALKAKNFDKAVELFRKAAEMDHKYAPNLSAALQQRAFAYVGEHKYKQAIDDYSAALDVTPGQSSIYEGRAYAEMMLEDYDSALKDYTKLIKLEPKKVGYYLRRSYIYEVQKDIPKAMADCNKVLQLDPNNAEAKDRQQRLLLAKAVKAANQLPTAPLTPPPTTPTPHKKKK
jgi:tetratricopeptide (TPR) repeat protein